MKRTLGMVVTVATVVALVLLPTATAHAADGALDPSFGGGSVLTNVGDSAWANDAVVDTQGRLVVVGATCAGGGCRALLVRYLPDGTLDPSFDTDGIVTGAFGEPEEAIGVAVQTDGMIVVVGTTSAAGGGFLARYGSNGSLDPGFGVGGWVATADPTPSSPYVVAVQPDGSILVGGQSDDAGTSRSYVARYSSAGVLDQGFGNEGRRLLPLSGDAWAAGIDLQSDGKIVMSSTELAGTWGSQMVVTRLLTGGAVDPSFGSNGATVIPMPAYASASRLTVTSDDRIAVSGFCGQAGDWHGHLSLLQPGGAMDTAFGGDGMVTYDPGTTYASFRDVEQDGAGLVVAGFSSGSGGERFVVARYGWDGALDPSFGTGGITEYTFGGSGSAGTALALDGIGGAYLAGVNYAPAYQLAVAKYSVSILQEPGAIAPDTTAPSITLLRPDRAYSKTRFAVEWAGTDLESGIAAYRVQVATGTTAWSDWYVGLDTSSKYSGSIGTSVCFRLSAVDVAGNDSGWSAERCTFIRG